MGLFDFFRAPASLSIADCFNRTTTHVETFPATLNGKSSEGETTPLCRIFQKRRRFFIESLNAQSLPLLDGQPIDNAQEIFRDRIYALALKGHLLAIVIASSEPNFGKGFNSGTWSIAERGDGCPSFELKPDELNQATLLERYAPTSKFRAIPGSLDAHFPLQEFISLLPKTGTSQTASNSSTPSYGKDAASQLPSSADSACPICWKTFGPGEVMNIAAHEALLGDPILGPHSKRRFIAKRFNELGQALDDRGVVSIEFACPHCRGRLPTSFLSQDHLILSVVGAPSSGKSYYLSTLLQLLPEELIRYRNCVLQDGDPSGNVQLNEMKNRLFSATTPEDAFISKTDFEGLMYEQLPRNGKTVALPRPFVYHLRHSQDASRRAALVFYDNAGEHFKPTVSLDDSPGALHVAASSALFFLYDPTANRAFRKQLRRKRDPQLRSQATDEQDTILAEMGIRVKKLKAKDSHEQIDTPLAIMAGKCDVWRSLLPPDSLCIPEDRPLSDSEIEQNSRVTRDLLLKHCPTIVANAESISSNVRYFPISPLGHSPKEILEGPLQGKLAPVPRRLKPILTTAPTLWAMKQILPEILADEASPI